VKAKFLSDLLLEVERANRICPICQVHLIEPAFQSEGCCELCFCDRAARYRLPSAGRIRRGIPARSK
jgi:hypothetical protein